MGRKKCHRRAAEIQTFKSFSLRLKLTVKVFWNYLEDGNCSISNSLAENCIRPFVIGRKNWLFSGSPKGAEASAGIYTLVETAKANGLAPMKYIKYILSDMPGSAFLEHPEYLDDYLPWNPLVKEFCR